MRCYYPFDNNLQLCKDFYAIHLHVINHVLLFILLYWNSFEKMKARCKGKWSMSILLAGLSLAVSKFLHYYAVFFFYFFCCRFYAWFMFTTLVYFLSNKVLPLSKRLISAAEHEDISSHEFYQMPVLSVEQEGTGEHRDSGLPSALNYSGSPSQLGNNIILPSPVSCLVSVPLSLIGLSPISPPSDASRFVNAESKSTFSETNQAPEISTKVQGIERRISIDGLNAQHLPQSYPSTSGYEGSGSINHSGTLTSPSLSRSIPFDQPGTPSQAAGRNTEGINIVPSKSNPDPPVANLLQSFFRQIHPNTQAPTELSPYSSGAEDGDTGSTKTPPNKILENLGDTTTAQKRKSTRTRKVKKPINYDPPQTRSRRQTKT